MTIMPVFRRELLVAVRRARLQRDRAIYVGIFLTIVLATFAVRYLLDGSRISRWTLSGIAWQSFGWIVAFHAVLVPMGIAAQSIAGEKDRRTLDFLLGTPLSSAEIVLESWRRASFNSRCTSPPECLSWCARAGRDRHLAHLPGLCRVVLPGGARDWDGALDLDRRARCGGRSATPCFSS